MFDLIKSGRMGLLKACAKGLVRVSGQKDALLPDETRDANCATVFSKTVGMSWRQHFHCACGFTAEAAIEAGFHVW